jgi:hypothetical protein
MDEETARKILELKEDLFETKAYLISDMLSLRNDILSLREIIMDSYDCDEEEERDRLKDIKKRWGGLVLKLDQQLDDNNT